MNQLKTEDKNALQGQETKQKDLHTEGPIPEKDEVKQAENRTAQNQLHDVDIEEKLKDDEGKAVKDTRQNQ